MGYDEKTAERVRGILAERRDVVEKQMVGGRSFMVAGSMCCGVTSEGLVVRVGPEGRAGALAEAHVRPMEFGGRAMAEFVLVEPEGFRDDAASESACREKAVARPAAWRTLPRRDTLYLLVEALHLSEESKAAL